MDKINTEASLQEEINLLKTRKAEKGNRLKEEFHDTYEKLKPANLVKSIFRKSVTSPGIRNFVIDKTVDVTLVLLTNIMLRRTSHSIVKRTLGTVLVLGIKNIVSRNPVIVKKAGNGIINTFTYIITKINRKREYTYNTRM